jgi:tape measure domain-containing protein
MGGFSNVLGSLSVVIGAEIDDYLNDLARVSKEAGTAVGEVEKKFEGLQTVGTQIAGLGAGLTAGITLPLAGLSALAISAAADMDSLMRGLTAVAGSSEEAGRQMARLKEVAKLPGLALEEAVQGSIRLQSVGVSAEQAERTMKAFGNALATVGKGAPDLEAVISQLVQMSSKTNVVAEDLKPIMERVPQVAAIMKQEFGTINTEVLQKLGVSTKEFTDKVIAGLERLPAVSGGVKNAMENLRDSSRAALTSIGQSLIPVLEKLTPVIEGLLGQVVKLAEWFRNLPAPVQAAVGAVVAFAAALGPVLVAIGGLTAAVGAAMPALTGLAVFFGTSVGALGTWTATIGLAVAALAFLTSQAIRPRREGRRKEPQVVRGRLQKDRATRPGSRAKRGAVSDQLRQSPSRDAEGGDGDGQRHRAADAAHTAGSTSRHQSESGSRKGVQNARHDERRGTGETVEGDRRSIRSDRR